MSQQNTKNSEGVEKKVSLWVPITKSRPVESGEYAGAIEVEGIATDESRDLDGERVIASRYPKAFEYLAKKGVFNLDHNKREIGRVTDVKWLSNKEATDLYASKGIIPEGNVVYIKGYIWPIDNPEIAPDDLKQAHFLSGLARQGLTDLGFSIEGTVLDRGTTKSANGLEENYAVPKLVHRVAITTQPKNSNAICMVKSMAELIDSDNESTDEQETMVIFKALPSPDSKNLVDDDSIEELSERVFQHFLKAVDSSVNKAGRHGDIKHPVTMGDKVPTSDEAKPNTQSSGKGRKTCLRCGYSMPKSHSYCGNCGTLCRSNTEARTAHAGKFGVVEENPALNHEGGKAHADEKKGDAPVEMGKSLASTGAYPTDGSTGVDAVKTTETDGEPCSKKKKNCNMQNEELDGVDANSRKEVEKTEKSASNILHGISFLLDLKRGDLIPADLNGIVKSLPSVTDEDAIRSAKKLPAPKHLSFEEFSKEKPEVQAAYRIIHEPQQSVASIAVDAEGNTTSTRNSVKKSIRAFEKMAGK